MRHLNILICILLLSIVFHAHSFAQDSFWRIQSIDTVKYSRDKARSPHASQKIPALVKAVADLGATHIGIDTPYDEEFYPYLAQWVLQARKNKLYVWFRGNFSGWEGWFSYPKFTNISEHHEQTYRFVTQHPELFEEGDIFTPAPEPENGIIGDPRSSAEKRKEYISFLETSYKTCTQAFLAIDKYIKCGYFSVNGDIAKYVLTKEVVQHTGNVVVIDHYLKDPKRLKDDILYFHNKFGVSIVLGEFGAPIPDIHGNFSEEQQEEYIRETLNVLYKKKAIIAGINYWTLIDSSSALLNENGSPRKVTAAIKYYYNPSVIKGIVFDTFGKPLKDAIVATSDGVSGALSDNKGNYRLPVLEGAAKIVTRKEGYVKKTKSISVKTGENSIQNIVLEAEENNMMYKIKTFIQNLKTKISEFLSSKI